MERLFLTIARINSVLLLLVLIGAGVSITWVTWSSSQWQSRGAIEVSTGEPTSPVKVLLRFEQIQNIPGANTQMILLSAEESSGKLSSGGYGSSRTRNVLFLVGAEKTARWLFTHHSNLILVTEQLREEIKESRDRPTKALYFEYVAADTNKDGKLTAQDLSSIGLAKPDGLGFIEVLSGVNRVLSHEFLDNQLLSVVYQSGKSVRLATFSIPSMKKETDLEIVNVPEEL